MLIRNHSGESPKDCPRDAKPDRFLSYNGFRMIMTTILIIVFNDQIVLNDNETPNKDKVT